MAKQTNDQPGDPSATLLLTRKKAVFWNIGWESISVQHCSPSLSVLLNPVGWKWDHLWEIDQFNVDKDYYYYTLFLSYCLFCCFVARIICPISLASSGTSHQSNIDRRSYWRQMLVSCALVKPAWLWYFPELRIKKEAEIGLLRIKKLFISRILKKYHKYLGLHFWRVTYIYGLMIQENLSQPLNQRLSGIFDI